MNTLSCRLGASILCAGFAACAHADATFLGLGFINDNYFESQAFGLSNNGVVTGISSKGATQRAFQWTQNNGMSDLGVLNDSTYSIGRAVSADGSIIVGLSGISGGDRFPVYWENDFIHQISGAGFGSNSQALAVSRDASMIVGTGLLTSGQQRGFRAAVGGEMLALPVSRQVHFSTSANGVSGNGRRIVGASTGIEGSRAVVWDLDQGGTATELPLPAGHFGSAQAISADGARVAGLSAEGLATQTGFVWDPVDGFFELPLLSASTVATPRGLNADGSVIVGSVRTPTSTEAAVWVGDGATTGWSMRDYLLAHGLDETLLFGWALTSVNAVSDDGLTFAGTGRYDGRAQAWIATVPAPATLPALLGLLALRRRR